jgi:hypothetical protein
VKQTSESSILCSSHATSFIENVAPELTLSKRCIAHTLFDTDVSTPEVVIEKNDTMYAFLDLSFGALFYDLLLGLFVAVSARFRVMAIPVLMASQSHPVRHTTLGRTPLDE